MRLNRITTKDGDIYFVNAKTGLRVYTDMDVIISKNQLNQNLNYVYFDREKQNQKFCPRCGIAYSEKENKCECGWDFSSNQWIERYQDENPIEAFAKTALIRLEKVTKCLNCNRVFPIFYQNCPFCEYLKPQENCLADSLICSIITEYYKDLEKNKIMKNLRSTGCSKDISNQLIDNTLYIISKLANEVIQTPKGKAEELENAKKRISNALIWISIGVFITIISIISDFPLAIIWYGPVCYGIFNLLRGLGQLRFIHKAH